MSGQENADNGNSPSSSPTGIVSAKSFKKPTITQAVDRVLISSGLLAAAASEQEAVSMAGLCGMIKVLCPEEDTKQIKKYLAAMSGRCSRLALHKQQWRIPWATLSLGGRCVHTAPVHGDCGTFCGPWSILSTQIGVGKVHRRNKRPPSKRRTLSRQPYQVLVQWQNPCQVAGGSS